MGLDRATGEPVPLRLEKGDTTRYGFDAARAYWRVALDLRWTGDGRARAYLSQAGFLRDEVQRKGEVSAVYARDGTIEERTPSVVGQAGALAALLTLDPPLAHKLYASRFVGSAVYVPAARPAGRAAPARLLGQSGRSLRPGLGLVRDRALRGRPAGPLACLSTRRREDEVATVKWQD